MDVPLVPNDIVIRNGLKRCDGMLSTFRRKFCVLRCSRLFVAVLLVPLGLTSSCSYKENGDDVGIPIDDMRGIVTQFENACENIPDWKLESSNHKLTVYTTQDEIEGYPSKCLILYHDGNQTKAVSEQLWRKKYGINDSVQCPLFSNGHRRLYTIENKLAPNTPIYVIVTEDLLENEYSTMDKKQSSDGMVVYAHAYTIHDGQLQPKEVFCSDGWYNYITERDTTMWVEWLDDIPSMWPAQYDRDTGYLRIGKVETYSDLHSVMLEQKGWRYDDKIGFICDDEFKISEHYCNDMGPYVVAMSELFSKHKIQINYDGIFNYQYASWPSDSAWTANPSIVVTGGIKDEEEGCISFKSEDNYEYNVFFNSHPEGLWPSISALEVRKEGKVIYKDKTEY